MYKVEYLPSVHKTLDLSPVLYKLVKVTQACSLAGSWRIVSSRLLVHGHLDYIRPCLRQDWEQQRGSKEGGYCKIAWQEASSCHMHLGGFPVQVPLMVSMETPCENIELIFTLTYLRRSRISIHFKNYTSPKRNEESISLIFWHSPLFPSWKNNYPGNIQKNDRLSFRNWSPE